MRNTPKIKGIQSALQALESPAVDLEYVAAPHTTISGRSQMVDLSKDGKPRFGVERVQVQDLLQLASESGPNGEAVYKPVNDWEDSVRFYGSTSGLVAGVGARINMSDIGDSAEFSFYGTGFNLLLAYGDGAERGFNVSIDGGADVFFSSIQSVVISNRNYAANIVMPIASNLNGGVPALHTIKITKTGGSDSELSGYEILNERSDVLVPAFTTGDGQKHPETTLALAAPGSKGGRALIYADASGVQQASQATDATALYLAAADHSNEEVIAEHFWREFGAGRGDDFSTLSGVSDRAFTLDDGTTTLVANDAFADQTPGSDTFASNASPGYTFTFVGTGLDVLVDNDPTLRNGTAYIDGVSIGAFDVAANEHKIRKVVSGLPYGTHTFKYDVATSGSRHSRFIVYGPKKPSLPKDAVELGEYFVMADYSANTVASNETLSSGVLRKMSTREITCVGTWSIGSVSVGTTGHINGFEVRGSSANATATFSFYGTGFDWRFRGDTNGAQNAEISVDGTLATAANFPSASFGVTAVAGISYNDTTARLDARPDSLTVGSGFSLSGLPLGFHTIELKNITASEQMKVDCIDIHVPIHAPKLNGPFVKQNSLRVGSESIGDLRKPSSDKKNVSKASGVTSSPTTTSSSYSPIPDAAASIETSGGDLAIDFEAIFTQSVSNAGRRFQIYLDGKLISYEYDDVDDVTNVTPGNSRIIIPVAPGIHYVHVMYAANAGGLAAYQTRRTLTLSEIKK